MRVEPPPAEEEKEPTSQRSELDRALEDLLVGETRVRIDPTSGQAVDIHVEVDGEKSPLTDSEEPPTIR